MELIKHFLPAGLLEIFDITSFTEQPTFFSIHLEEKNNIPAQFKADEYESKGFYKIKNIQARIQENADTEKSHSYLKASIGSRLAALRAGNQPKNIPMAEEKINERR